MVQATIHFMMKTITLFTTPNCPTTIALGNLERRVAALKTLGARNEEPNPPMKNPKIKSV